MFVNCFVFRLRCHGVGFRGVMKMLLLLLVLFYTYVCVWSLSHVIVNTVFQVAYFAETNYVARPQLAFLEHAFVCLCFDLFLWHVILIFP